MFATGLLMLSTFAADLTPPQKDCLAHAWRHERQGWVFVHVEGAARDRGFQHGYLLAREIADNLRVQRVVWRHDTALEWPWLVEKARAMFEPKLDAELLAEIDGLVEGLQAAGVPTSRAEMITCNGYYELAWYWWPKQKKAMDAGTMPSPRESCSSFIATGSATADGNVVLAHNTMIDYPEANANVVMDVVPERGHRILWQTCPGWLHSGTDFFITDAGLVGSETTIGAFEGFDETAVPEFARMRRATQDAGSIDEWCALMKKGNNGGYANAWLVGDIHSKEIARLELGLKYVALERKQDGWFLGSNVAEDAKLLRFETTANEQDVRLSSVARRERWKQLVRANAGHIDVGRAQRFEADHFDYWRGKVVPGSRTLCGHDELDADPIGPWPGAPYFPAGTIDAKVVDARMAAQMAFTARWGAACGREFNAPRFLASHTQFDWMKDILTSRPTRAWTTFHAGERN